MGVAQEVTFANQNVHADDREEARHLNRFPHRLRSSYISRGQKKQNEWKKARDIHT